MTRRFSPFERIRSWLASAFAKPASVTEALSGTAAVLEETPQLAAPRPPAEPAVSPYWKAIDERDAQTLPGRRFTCPICERTETRESLEMKIDHCVFGGGRLERYVCPACGCIYGPAKYIDLDPAFIAADYASLYTEYAESDTTESEVRAFRSLHPTRSGVYLNWGSGKWNKTISSLRAEGYDVRGYEPSAQPSETSFIMRSKADIIGRFDGLFSNNVIEHFTRPVEEFRYFHSILAPGALMAHATPCYNYAYAFTRFHVVFLTGESPHVLAERSGFKVVAREEDGEFGNCVFERL